MAPKRAPAGVEIGDEGCIVPEQEQQENDRQANQPAPEAELLHPGIPFHADGNVDEYDETHRQHADELSGGGGREPQGGIFEARDRQQGCVYLIGQHLTIERRPQPQDEPPAGDRQHKTNGAVQDAALPDVVTSCARHGRDQAGVYDHFEDGEDGSNHHPGYQAAPEVIAVGEDEQAEGNQVDRESGINERIEHRPGSHQAACLANE